MDHQLPIVETVPQSAGSEVARPTLHLQWPDEAATQAFAALLARQPGLADAFVTLQGDLGAGKTTLARHLLQALGVQGRIKSPTYTIVESYEARGLGIWHFDFYRFNDPQEWEDAGFRDVFASPGLKLAEWPHKAHGLLPQADLDIGLQAQGDALRVVCVTAHTARGAAVLHGLAAAPSGQGGAA